MLFNTIGDHLGKRYLRIIHLFSDRQNGDEVQTETEMILERQRQEIQMSKNNPLSKPQSSARTLDNNTSL